LRSGAALIIAALMADGESEISAVEHVDRGYESFEQKLINLGASIRRVSKKEISLDSGTSE
ncbi:MAG: UDP-N-acetylglucosamine 1-carboxyvinyltransferase, partial [Dethiobacteria bacterium]|nr:UDP-N-acetylglucosamine 1-carboxyvinyltransferase [Dethiobacteria bacterium]